MLSIHLMKPLWELNRLKCKKHLAQFLSLVKNSEMPAAIYWFFKLLYYWQKTSILRNSIQLVVSWHNPKYQPDQPGGRFCFPTNELYVVPPHGRVWVSRNFMCLAQGRALRKLSMRLLDLAKLGPQIIQTNEMWAGGSYHVSQKIRPNA